MDTKPVLYWWEVLDTNGDAVAWVTAYTEDDAREAARERCQPLLGDLREVDAQPRLFPSVAPTPDDSWTYEDRVVVIAGDFYATEWEDENTVRRVAGAEKAGWPVRRWAEAFGVKEVGWCVSAPPNLCAFGGDRYRRAGQFLAEGPGIGVWQQGGYYFLIKAIPPDEARAHIARLSQHYPRKTKLGIFSHFSTCHLSFRTTDGVTWLGQSAHISADEIYELYRQWHHRMYPRIPVLPPDEFDDLMERFGHTGARMRGLGWCWLGCRVFSKQERVRMAALYEATWQVHQDRELHDATSERQVDAAALLLVKPELGPKELGSILACSERSIRYCLRPVGVRFRPRDVPSGALEALLKAHVAKEPGRRDGILSMVETAIGRKARRKLEAILNS